MNRRQRGDAGQALVEFALVVPVLMLMIMGLVEFARAWQTQQVLTDAARESLRSAVVANSGFTYETLRGRLDYTLRQASLDPEKAQVAVEGWKTGTGTPARITIDYQYDFGFFGPFISWSTGGRSIALSTSYVMRNE